MSPASRSKNKSKDKASARSSKEQQKASFKSSGSSNSVGGTPTSGYNPISGTFHSLEIPSAASSPPFVDNGRIRNIDDTDENSSSPHGTISDYDWVSHSGSCSGESDDPKEKINSSVQQKSVLGLDNDRREKIRLKNEKKHQRQKEKRAQELHERCRGYLMSRKLEALSQEVVTMGFSPEWANLALMLNEGRVEESVNWLLERNEGDTPNMDIKSANGGNWKIDISEELDQISELEVRYKCSKQEVERAVVACEGDLVKAEETLCAQKGDSPPCPPMTEETTDAKILKRPQENPAVTASITIQQRRNERDFNYTRSQITVPTYSEPGNGNLQAMNQPNLLGEKRWSTKGSSPSFSSPMATCMQSPPISTKLEFRLGLSGNEGQKLQQVVREPLVMMQHPQSLNAKQNPVHSLSMSPSVTAGWYSNNVTDVENVRSNGKLHPSQSSGSHGLVNQSSEQFYHPASYKETPVLFSNLVDSASVGLGGSWSTMGKSLSLTAPSELQHSYIAMDISSPSPSLVPPSSIRLFAGYGSAGALGSSSNVDWSMGGLMPEFDYNSIDWTLDSNQLSSKSNGIGLGVSSLLRKTADTRMSSLNGSCTSMLQDAGVAKETSSAGLREWTSPFAGKDIFSLHRQFVTSPSL